MGERSSMSLIFLSCSPVDVEKVVLSKSKTQSSANKGPVKIYNFSVESLCGVVTYLMNKPLNINLDYHFQLKTVNHIHCKRLIGKNLKLLGAQNLTYNSNALIS